MKVSLRLEEEFKYNYLVFFGHFASVTPPTLLNERRKAAILLSLQRMMGDSKWGILGNVLVNLFLYNC